MPPMLCCAACSPRPASRRSPRSAPACWRCQTWSSAPPCSSSCLPADEAALLQLALALLCTVFWLTGSRCVASGPAGHTYPHQAAWLRPRWCSQLCHCSVTVQHSALTLAATVPGLVMRWILIADNRWRPCMAQWLAPTPLATHVTVLQHGVHGNDKPTGVCAACRR